MKQQKYIMFTKLQLETMLKIADQKKIYENYNEE